MLNTTLRVKHHKPIPSETPELTCAAPERPLPQAAAGQPAAAAGRRSRACRSARSPCRARAGARAAGRARRARALRRPTSAIASPAAPPASTRARSAATSSSSSAARPNSAPPPPPAAAAPPPLSRSPLVARIGCASNPRPNPAPTSRSAGSSASSSSCSHSRAAAAPSGEPSSVSTRGAGTRRPARRSAGAAARAAARHSLHSPEDALLREPQVDNSLVRGQATRCADPSGAPGLAVPHADGIDNKSAISFKFQTVLHMIIQSERVGGQARARRWAARACAPSGGRRPGSARRRGGGCPSPGPASALTARPPPAAAVRPGGPACPKPRCLYAPRAPQLPAATGTDILQANQTCWALAYIRTSKGCKPAQDAPHQVWQYARSYHQAGSADRC